VRARMSALEMRDARGAGADARAQLCPSRRYFDAADYVYLLISVISSNEITLNLADSGVSLQMKPSYFSSHIVETYFESFSKHSNNVYFHYVLSEL